MSSGSSFSDKSLAAEVAGGLHTQESQEFVPIATATEILGGSAKRSLLRTSSGIGESHRPFAEPASLSSCHDSLPQASKPLHSEQSHGKLDAAPSDTHGVFATQGSTPSNRSMSSATRNIARATLNDMETALLDLIRIPSLPQESLAAAVQHVGTMQTNTPEAASRDDDEAALSMMSRVSISATAQERERLVSAIRMWQPKRAIQERDLRSAASATGPVGYRVMMKAVEAHMGAERVSAGDVAASAYSAVNNPLFGLLAPSVWGPICTNSRSRGKRNSLLMLGHVATLEGANDVLYEALQAQQRSFVSKPEVVFGMPTTHWLRKRVIAVTLTHVFERVMLLAVLLSCVQMMLEHPRILEGSLYMRCLQGIERALTAVFLLELLCKVVTFGFRGYWAITSNKMDAIIVFTSILVIAVESSGLTFFKALRVFRALNAMRVATRSSTMQQIINSMAQSMASMFNVTVLLLIVFVMFAVLGMQLFSGLFWECTDPSVGHRSECVGTFVPLGGAEPVPREWQNNIYTFDSLPSALLTLFVVSTLEGYSPIMTAAMAAPPSKGMQPQQDSNPYNAYFFVAFIVVAVFVMLNLYVGMPLLTALAFVAA
jgi:hypothetical protein